MGIFLSFGQRNEQPRGKAVEVSKGVTLGRDGFVSDLEGRGIGPRDPASPLHSVRDQFEYEFSDRKFCLTELIQCQKFRVGR